MVEHTGDTYQILRNLDTGRWSILHSLFPSSPARDLGLWTGRLFPYIITVALTYGVLFCIALVSLPTAHVLSLEQLKLPFLFDCNLHFMFLVSLPLLVVFILTERELIPSSISRIAKEGVLLITFEKAEGLRETWERRYKVLNLIAQIVGVIVGLAVALANHVVYTQEGLGSWQTTNNQMNAAGWAYLFCVFIFYFVVAIFGLRGITAIVFLRELEKESEIDIIPFHPDKCGGLRPVGTIGLRNQYILTVIGLNILLLILVAKLFLKPNDGFSGFSALVVAAGITYIIMGPLVFLGPLIPFRKGMLRAKTDLTELVARRIGAEFQRIEEQLEKGKVTQEDEELLDRLKKIGELIERLPVWPFDTATLRKFLGAYILPLLTMVSYPLGKTFVNFLLRG